MKRKIVSKLLIGCAAAVLLLPAQAQAALEENTVQIEEEARGVWLQSGNRWWYRHNDGSYTTSGWEFIDNEWYYFDKAGWMTTGWQKVNGTWYYMDTSGKMLTDWQLVNGKWYYMYESGAMAADTWIGDYYVNSSGAWVQGKTKPQPTWIKSGNRWWYRHGDGSYTTNGWEFINGYWFYFDESGWMVTGWKQLYGNWYYMGSDGAMVTGWQKINGIWYYMYESGAMAADTWIGEYYVDANGAWDPNMLAEGWIKSGDRWWYRHKDGSRTISNWEQINGFWFYFDEEGWMVTGWLQLADGRYYLKEDGSRASEEWIGTTGIGGLYVGADGKMIAGTSYIIGNMTYTFDANGVCTSQTEERYVTAKDPINGKSYKLEKQFLTDPQVGVDVTEDEFLAAVVYAEAGNQKMPGMTGVALVILNRMNDTKYNYPKSANFVIYQAGQFEVARDGKLTKWLKNKDSATLNDAKKAVQCARQIMDAYVSNGTNRTVDGLTMPEGKTDFDYLGFMTPAAFNAAGLDWEKTEAFTYLNTTFYTRWITKSSGN